MTEEIEDQWTQEGQETVEDPETQEEAKDPEVTDLLQDTPHPTLRPQTRKSDSTKQKFPIQLLMRAKPQLLKLLRNRMDG